MLSAGSQNHADANRQMALFGGNWRTTGADGRITGYGGRAWVQENVLTERNPTPAVVYMSAVEIYPAMQIAKNAGHKVEGKNAMELIVKGPHEGGLNGPNGGRAFDHPSPPTCRNPATRKNRLPLTSLARICAGLKPRPHRYSQSQSSSGSARSSRGGLALV
jgi:hypothetical protein